MDVLRHEYLESVLNQQFENYDYLGIAGGFVFDTDRYRLQLQTPDGGFVERECYSLLEVATVISFKLNCWTENEVGSVPDFATAALSAKTPADFINKYLEIRRYKRIEISRRLWFTWLVSDKEYEGVQAERDHSLASLILENYDEAVIRSYEHHNDDDSFKSLGLDRSATYKDILADLRPIIMENIKLHRPHVYALHPLCRDIIEVERLLKGDTGFLSTRKAHMSSAQRDHLFAGDLGL